MEKSEKLQKAIKMVQDAYCQKYIGIPYLLIGDVAELIETLLEEKCTVDDIEINKFNSYVRSKDLDERYPLG